MNTSGEVQEIRGSLRRRIVASVLLGLAVVLVGIASLVGVAVTQSLQAALAERLAFAYAKEHEVSQEIEDRLATLARVAALWPSTMAADRTWGPTPLLEAAGPFAAIAVVDAQGSVVDQSGPTVRTTEERASWVPVPTVLRPLLALGRPVVLGAQGPRLILAAPTRDAGTGLWLVAEMDKRRLTRHLVGEHSIHGTYEAELLTETGTVVVGFPQSNGVSVHAALIARHADRGEAGVVAHRGENGTTDHYVAYVPLQPVPQWGVVVEQPRDVVVALPQQLWRWMMGIGLFVLIAGAVVAWLDVGRVVMPLRQLAAYAERFGRGDLDAGIQIDRNDEIGLLGKTLEEMRLRLRAAQTELRNLSALAERERIARELHDGLAQALGIIYARARAAGAQITARHDSARAALDEIASISSQAYEEVRQSIFGLRTMVSRRLGLVPALTEYLHEFSERTGVHVELDVPDPFPTLPLEVEAQLIRIVQEAVTNVWRHAQATRAWVRLTTEGGDLTLVVEDDGVGFDPDAAPVVVTRFGLEAMRERAEAIGGRLHLESAPGRGTRVVLTRPTERG